MFCNTYNKRMDGLENASKRSQLFKYSKTRNPFYTIIYSIRGDSVSFYEFKENIIFTATEHTPLIIINADCTMSTQEIAQSIELGLQQRINRSWCDGNATFYPKSTVVECRRRRM